MIASHTLTYLHADGRERTLTLYSNERIASGLAALVADYALLSGSIT